MIVAELVDGCNLDCLLCYNRDRTGSFINMPLDVVDAVIEKYGSEPRIDWHNWGEPLLHKQFIDVAHKVAGTNSRVSSSLSLTISDRKFDAIHNFSQIVVSLSGITEKTYKIYHRGGNFGLVMANLEKLAGNKKNNVRVQWLEHYFNPHERKACQEMCKKLGVGFSAKGLNCEVENQVSGFQHGLLKTTPTNRSECYLLSDIVIGVDGDYLLCCASHNVKIGLNIRDSVSQEEIIKAKMETELCMKCRKGSFWKMY